MRPRVTMIDPDNEVHALADAIECVRRRWSTTFDCAVICGSGMSDWMGHADVVDRISYTELNGFPKTSVKGHGNSLVHLRFGDKNLLAFSGRFHLYEGWELSDVVKPVFLSSALGIKHLVCTNAAGGLQSGFEVGDLMVAGGLLNVSGRHLTIEKQRRSGPIIDEVWTTKVCHELRSAHWLKRGVYCSVSGPSYETRAEIAMFSRFADAIGMSTVHEALCARLVGMNILACSVISNSLCIPHEHVLQHEDVLIATQAAASRIANVLDACCHTLN